MITAADPSTVLGFPRMQVYLVMFVLAGVTFGLSAFVLPGARFRRGCLLVVLGSAVMATVVGTAVFTGSALDGAFWTAAAVVGVLLWVVGTAFIVIPSDRKSHHPQAKRRDL